MASTTLLDRSFENGFKQDFARDELPSSTAWNLRDWLPRNGEPLVGRGPYAYWSGDLNAVHAASKLSAVGWAALPRPSTSSGDRVDQLIMVDGNGDVFARSDPHASVSDAYVGAASSASPVSHPMFQWRNKFLFVVDGVWNKIELNATTSANVLANLGGSPPLTSCGMAWGDYLIVANGRTNTTNRMYWSDVGNIESWVTSALAAGSFMDMPDEIVALGQTKNSILIFGYRDTWQLLGDIPPPGGNMSRKDFALGNGCMDARTVCHWKDYVFWANTNGIWKTDGSLPTNITEQAGISRFWRALVQTFSTVRGWVASAGVLYGNLFITIKEPTGPAYTTIVINLDSYVVTTISNIKTVMYGQRVGGPGGTGFGGSAISGGEELFFAHDTLPRAGRLSAIFTPPPGVATDPDNTDILPYVETPYYRMNSTGLKRLRNLYANYDLRDMGTSNPFLEVGHVLTPDATGYTMFSEHFTETTKWSRRSIGVRLPAQGIAFLIQQGNTSGLQRLGALEIEHHDLEESR